MSDYSYVPSDIHVEITDRICELENYIEGFSAEEIRDFAEEEVAEARGIIDGLEYARYLLDQYLW